MRRSGGSGFNVHHPTLSSVADQEEQHANTLQNMSVNAHGIQLSSNAQSPLAVGATQTANGVFSRIPTSMDSLQNRFRAHTQNLRANSSGYATVEADITSSLNQIHPQYQQQHLGHTSAGAPTLVASGSGTYTAPTMPHGGNASGNSSTPPDPLSAQGLSNSGLAYNHQIWQTQDYANQQTKPSKDDRQNTYAQINQFMANGPGPALAQHGFTVTGGNAPHDPVVKHNGQNPTTYNAFVGQITAPGHDSRVEAQQLSDWANGRLPFGQLPPHVQDIAVITHFSEPGRGYYSATQNIFDPKMTEIANMSTPQEANQAWHDLVHNDGPKTYYPAGKGDALVYRPHPEDGEEPYTPSQQELADEQHHGVGNPDTEMTDAELAQYQQWRNSQTQG